MRPADFALFVLRLSGLSLALLHGLGKVRGLASGEGGRLIEGVATLGFPSPEFFAWAAALSEFAGGLLVAVGLGTRLFAPFPAITMFVAAFVQHKAHLQWISALGIAPVSPETIEQWGNPELALVYLASFVALTFLGAGRLSLDRLFARKGASAP